MTTNIKQSAPVEEPSQTTDTNPPAIPRLAYNLNEAAQSLGISYISAFRLVQRGKLKSIRALRHHLIPRSELLRFLAQ
jgi:excisionase family DNA binding protein